MSSSYNDPLFESNPYYDLSIDGKRLNIDSQHGGLLILIDQSYRGDSSRAYEVLLSNAEINYWQKQEFKKHRFSHVGVANNRLASVIFGRIDAVVFDHLQPGTYFVDPPSWLGGRLPRTKAIVTIVARELGQLLWTNLPAPVAAPIPPYIPDPRYRSAPYKNINLASIPEGVNLQIDSEHGALIVQFDSISAQVWLSTHYEGQKSYQPRAEWTLIEAYPVGQKKRFSRQQTVNLAIFPHVKAGSYEFSVRALKIEARVIVKIVAGELGMLDLTEYK